MGTKLRGLPDENIFFIIRFYTIMHRTTIVQNKILSIICSCFFCPANIYRPSLGKVRLGKTKMYRLGGELNSVVC